MLSISVIVLGFIVGSVLVLGLIVRIVSFFRFNCRNNVLVLGFIVGIVSLL